MYSTAAGGPGFAGSRTHVRGWFFDGFPRNGCVCYAAIDTLRIIASIIASASSL